MLRGRRARIRPAAQSLSFPITASRRADGGLLAGADPCGASSPSEVSQYWICAIVAGVVRLS